MAVSVLLLSRPDLAALINIKPPIAAARLRVEPKMARSKLQAVRSAKEAPRASCQVELHSVPAALTGNLTSENCRQRKHRDDQSSEARKCATDSVDDPDASEASQGGFSWEQGLPGSEGCGREAAEILLTEAAEKNCIVPCFVAAACRIVFSEPVVQVYI